MSAEEVYFLDGDTMQNHHGGLILHEGHVYTGTGHNKGFPLAVEMAKLSLWLITLDRNRSFTFLDHALKHGDSIIGADEEMFLRWAQSQRDSAMPLFAESLREELDTARQKRRELQSFEVE